jgi:hypothetical protein
MYDSMSEEQLRDFAKTKTDGLPKQVEKESAARRTSRSFVMGYMAGYASR